jgi:uncharacterized membrane protein
MCYLPQWYTAICKLHPRCDFIGRENARILIDDLTGFFLHQNELPPIWTQKEKTHLSEVRSILDTLAAIFVVAVFGFVLTFNKKKITKTILVNMAIILALSTLLLFFKFFWVKVFHPLLFSNDFWMNTPYDRSFYIMPGVFFKYSMIAFFIGVFIINAVIWSFNRKAGKKRESIFHLG